MDYIILQHKEGEYYPTTFSDGALVIYGSHKEAWADCKHGEIIAQIIITKPIDKDTK